MKNIKIQVSNKIASLVNNDEFLVCGNSDYTVTFEFDEGWENYVVKTALFVFGNEAVAKVFEGDTCEGVSIEGATKCYIGCYAGDLRTTTPATIDCLASIRDYGSVPNPPSPEVYDQIMDLLNKYIQGGGGEGGSAVSPTVSVTPIDGGHRVTITDVNGAKSFDVMNGKDGDKGDKGDPYTLTEADRETIVQDVLNALPNGDEVAY